MAVLMAEPGHERVLDVLYDSRDGNDARLLMPFVVLMEIEYMLSRRFGTEEASRILDSIESWPVEERESSRDWRRVAAGVKTSGGLSFADAWIAALALLEDAELVHKDPEFDLVMGLKALRLPYTPRLSREEDAG